MTRLIVLWLCAAGSAAFAQSGGIQQGTVKSLDIDSRTITLTVNGESREFKITPETRIFGAEQLKFPERLAEIKVGEAMYFKESARSPGTLEGLKALPGAGRQPAPDGTPQRLPTVPTNLTPLTDLGPNKYQGFEGGLYPDGHNERPAAHEQAGLRLARQVQPLAADGQPNPNGRIVLLSVGMSNTAQASEGFARQLALDMNRNPRLTFVNGAQGGMTAHAIQDPDDQGTGTRYWTTVDDRLRNAGVTAEQVQVVWIKQADAGPTAGFPGYARTLQSELAEIVRVLPKRFPNVKLAYLSSRTYGGFARSPLNPEPYAYESGFSVKWLIGEQIAGAAELNYDASRGRVEAPWLSWGPYLWANGNAPRRDGFHYEENDFAGDGTHESPAGQAKVGQALLHFFQTDTSTRPWFVRP